MKTQHFAITLVLIFGAAACSNSMRSGPGTVGSEPNAVSTAGGDQQNGDAANRETSGSGVSTTASPSATPQSPSSAH